MPIYAILTMFLHGDPRHWNDIMNHDQRLFIQAEMMTLLEEMPANLVEHHPLQFLMHLDQIRQKAAQHQLSALHNLACACESELQKTIANGGGVIVASAYLDAMRESLDCEEISGQMAEALMANVALRLGGQP